MKHALTQKTLIRRPERFNTHQEQKHLKGVLLVMDSNIKTSDLQCPLYKKHALTRKTLFSDLNNRTFIKN